MSVTKIGTEADETIVVQGNEILGGIFNGLGGIDTLQLMGDTTGPYALTFDFRTAQTFDNFEIIKGTATTDYIKLTSAQFAKVGTFDSGTTSYTDFVQVEGAVVDLRNKSFVGTVKVSLLTAAAEAIADSKATIELIRPSSGQQLRVGGITLTDGERRQYHGRGFDKITDASGISSFDEAPTLTGIGGDKVLATSQQTVHLDVGADAVPGDRYGFYDLNVETGNIFDTWSRLDIDTSGAVSLGAGIYPDVFVNNVKIATLTHLFSGKLTFRFTQDATPALVQELVRAITYVNTKSALPYGQEVVTWTLTDAGQRETKVTSFIQFANNAPTDISLSATQVAKSAASGTLVAKITGTDPNIGDSLTYTLLNGAGSPFGVNAQGELVVVDSSRFGALGTSHTVMLRATDRGGLSTDKTFNIVVSTTTGGGGSNPPASEADIARGTSGADTLRTGTGADVLIGYRGADKLYGGSGADIFIYSTIKDSTAAAKGRDTIYDFSRSEKDVIDLHGLDANTRKKGDQAFKFIGSSAFHKTAGELRYEKAKGGLTVYADVNGDGRADFGVSLKGVTKLVKGDFFL